MLCGKCGSHIAEGSICCPVCGTQVLSVGFSKAADLTVQQGLPGASTPRSHPPAAPSVRPAEVPFGQIRAQRPAAEFCAACGTGLEPGSRFCLACGQSVGQEAQPKREAPKPPKKKRKASRIILLSLALLLVAVAVGLVLYLMLGAKTPEAVAKEYLQAVLEGDAQSVLQFLPAEAVEELVEAEGYEDEAELCHQKAKDMAQMLDQFDPVWGPGWTYEIRSAEVRSWVAEETDRICEQYELSYGYEIQDAVIVYVDVQFKGQLRSETKTEKICLIQMDGKWYLDHLAHPDLFHC